MVQVVQYLLYPEMEETNSFPPEIRQALADSPEFQPKKVPVGTNLDTLLVPGNYAVSSGVLQADSDAANLPIHESGTVQVGLSASSGNIQVQTYTSNTKSMYVRRRNGGVWSAWRHFGPTRTSQTAGRAIYAWDEINQREQLVYGDTGWRDMTGLLSNGFLGNLHLRRQNGMVSIRAALKCAPTLTTMNGTFLSALPAGFIGAGSPWLFFPVRNNGNGTWFTMYKKGAELSFEGSPAITDAMETRFEISYSNVDAWPTSLPGAALNAIPFN